MAKNALVARPLKVLRPIRIMDTLPPQVRDSRIVLSKFVPIRNKALGYGDLSMKPFGSGLWTSTWTPNEKYCSDWMRWCVDEDFHVDTWRYAYVYQPRKNLRIVDTAASATRASGTACSRRSIIRSARW